MTDKQVQELLLPRVEVVADYPYSEFRKGDVLKYEEIVPLKDKPHTAFIYVSNDGHFTYKQIVDKCHVVFRALNWYEKRKIEDMPKYLKVIAPTVNGYDHYHGDVIKCGVDVFWNSNEYSTDGGWVDAYGGIYIECFCPITEAEYLTTSK